MIPNMIISSPMNEEELRNLMYTAQEKNNGPFVIRYPKGYGVMTEMNKAFKAIQIGKGRMLLEGSDLAILSIGHVGNTVEEACKILEKEGIGVAHADIRFLKPIDKELLHKICKNHNKIITVEDGTIVGGFGSAVIEFISENGYNVKLIRLGVPDQFIEHGSQSELYHECGFDVQGIIHTVRSFVTPKMFSQAV